MTQDRSYPRRPRAQPVHPARALEGATGERAAATHDADRNHYDVSPSHRNVSRDCATTRSATTTAKVKGSQSENQPRSKRHPAHWCLVGVFALATVTCDSALDPVPNNGSPPGPDVNQPFPIDRGDEGVRTPGTYKGLWLRLADTGQPTITPVDSLVVVLCIGMMESAGGCADFTARITSHWVNERASNVFVVNCGQAGFGIESWMDPDFDRLLWEPCLYLLQQWFGLRDRHVTILYSHVASETDTSGGAGLPAYPDPESGFFKMKENLTTFTKRLPHFLPNLKAVYLSSRTYGGFSTRGEGAPHEPDSYEEGHALNSWISENARSGRIWYGWGAYQWAPACESGITNGQEICYYRDDYRANGFSPSASGRGKMSWQMHYRLLREDWYRRS